MGVNSEIKALTSFAIYVVTKARRNNMHIVPKVSFFRWRYIISQSLVTEAETAAVHALRDVVVVRNA